MKEIQITLFTSESDFLDFLDGKVDYIWAFTRGIKNNTHVIELTVPLEHIQSDGHEAYKVYKEPIEEGWMEV